MSLQRGRLFAGRLFAGRLLGGASTARRRALVSRGGALWELDLIELGLGLVPAVSDSGIPLVWDAELQCQRELEPGEILEV